MMSACIWSARGRLLKRSVCESSLNSMLPTSWSLGSFELRKYGVSLRARAMLAKAVKEHRYENWLRAAGYRPDTVGRALELARRYLAACKANDVDPMAVESVSDLLAHAGRRIKRVSLLNYWKEIQTLMRCAVAQGIATQNPCDFIPRPRPTLHER